MTAVGTALAVGVYLTLLVVVLQAWHRQVQADRRDARDLAHRRAARRAMGRAAGGGGPGQELLTTDDPQDKMRHRTNDGGRT